MDAGKPQRLDVAIIGAGWYGLVTARTYLRLRPATKLLIVDSEDTVGGVWSKNRLYPGLVAQVSVGFFNYSDTPMSPNNEHSNDPRVTGEMIYDYLQKYADDHDLLRRIRLKTFVRNATRLQDGGWRLYFRNCLDIIETDKLIVATGITSIPNMPTLDEDCNDGSVPTLHARDLGNALSMIRDKDEIQEIAVVGAAKSACDAVYSLLNMGKRVKWLIREEGAGPIAILPSNLIGGVHCIALTSTRLMSYLSPSILNCQGLLYRAFQKSSLGRWFITRFWELLGTISYKNAGYDQGDHVKMLEPEFGRQGVFWCHSGLGIITAPNFWPTLHSPALTVLRDRIKSINKGTVHLQKPDSTPFHSDFMLMCTGWGDHFSMFDAPHKKLIGLPTYQTCCDALLPIDYEQGTLRDQEIDWISHEAVADRIVQQKLPLLTATFEIGHKKRLDPHRQRKWRLYRRVIPVELAAKGDRSIAILGQIHTAQTPLVAEIQSFWAVLYLLGEIEIPSIDVMAKEVALWNAWTRMRYLNQGQVSPYSLYDFLPYIDLLFQDLGLKSRRKSNPISEFFSPYSPRDFNGFIDEYLQLKQEAKQ
ncbi:hypothetical protein ASPZODRAFT_77332 [Penicilliopsis zonata CBS 506.65]|uniref:FAD/NAD(P)-binding domain-containing protein n=1 Tax=Penicilliopsis zonata CBS 506.65 TaxID=1073090 RepID=A0A1L9S507_9EURO|nr:hypothetical protein ASPZODRAFT_77332 [Penicilliopsis zonata CBS 506.65]OJJ42249.1 hypothetical protein ASPZODRAFT_77332 [Penicilliopsis zonata CBS 506.65]